MRVIIYSSFIIYFGYLIFLSMSLRTDFPEKLSGNGFYPFLADKPITEDGFYMLTVARNFAKTGKFEYNDHILTTGVQPLTVIYFAVPFKISQLIGQNDFFGLRLIIILSGLNLVLFCLVLQKIIEKLYPKSNFMYSWYFAVWFSIFNFDLFIQFTNGLETGLYLLLISFVILISIRMELNLISEVCIFALIIGVTILARLDFILPTIIFSLFFIVKKRIRIIHLFFFSLTILLIVFPWFVFVKYVTGSFIQSSITAQTSMLQFSNIILRLDYLIKALLEIITPGIYFGNKYSLLYLFVVFELIVLLGFYFRYKIVFNLKKEIYYWSLAFSMYILVYYFYSNAPYFYLRYLSPLSIFILIYLFPLFELMVGYLKFKIKFIVFIIIIFLFQSYLYFNSGNLGVPQSLRISYIKKHFTASNRIGVFQSGVTGFFCRNVYNLDGKIDARSLNYLSQANLEDYLDKKHINIIIEWKEVFGSEYFQKYWNVYNSNIGDGKTIVLIRKNKIE